MPPHPPVSPGVSITERVSPHALDMESNGAEGVLKALGKCDRELWNDEFLDEDDNKSHPGLSHPDITGRIAFLSEAVARCIAGDSSNTPTAVFIVGCGTSGRLAFQTARAAQAMLDSTSKNKSRNVFRHVIAGGDAALFQSAESCEDDWKQGADDFERHVALAGTNESHLTQGVVIGISCGLSAKYVASILNSASEDNRFFSCAIGFNPLRHASPKNGFTGLNLVSEVTKSNNTDIHDQVLLMNPVVGPELIAGSSRLKGGTATKMILDSAFFTSFFASEQVIGNNDTNAVSLSSLHQVTTYAFDVFRDVTQAVGNDSNFQQTAAAIAHNLSHSLWANTLGAVKIVSVAEFAERENIQKVSADTVVALIDASEQNPTFGTSIDQYRAWGGDGWQGLGIEKPKGCFDWGWDAYLKQTEEDQKKKGGSDEEKEKTSLIFLFAPGRADDPKFASAQRNAVRDALAMETRHNTSITTAFVCVRHSRNDSLVPPWDEGEFTKLFETEPQKLFIDLCGEDRGQRTRAGVVSRIPTTLSSWLSARTHELCLKQILNAISVTGHCLLGKTLNGRMVDVRVSNEKLFFRACGIVRDVSGTSIEDATKAVVTASSGLEGLECSGGSDINSIDGIDYKFVSEQLVTQVIASAKSKPHVTPCAILIARGACSTYSEAKQLIADSGNVGLLLRSKLGR